jgi:hypothetical protein
MNSQPTLAQSEIATVTALFRRITMSSLERILKPSFWALYAIIRKVIPLARSLTIKTHAAAQKQAPM